MAINVGCGIVYITNDPSYHYAGNNGQTENLVKAIKRLKKVFIESKDLGINLQILLFYYMNLIHSTTVTSAI